MSPPDLDDPADGDRLFASLYDELHRIAHRALYKEGGRLSISTTTLLHEAYLNISVREDMSFPDRRQLPAYAARAVRSRVIDAARRKQAIKRGSGFEITRLHTGHGDEVPDEQQLNRIDEALEAWRRSIRPLQRSWTSSVSVVSRSVRSAHFAALRNARCSVSGRKRDCFWHAF